MFESNRLTVRSKDTEPSPVFIIGIPVGILALMASDAFGILESKLRYKNKNDIYTFNWLVAYSNQVIGQSKSTAVLLQRLLTATQSTLWQGMKSFTQFQHRI